MAIARWLPWAFFDVFEPMVRLRQTTDHHTIIPFSYHHTDSYSRKMFNLKKTENYESEKHNH
ncbi:MAG: hypothetical protein IIU93_09025, partial [Alistipes sp.]|nr:hypothetical protein [Alistipes sp.]